MGHLAGTEIKVEISNSETFKKLQKFINKYGDPKRLKNTIKENNREYANHYHSRIVIQEYDNMFNALTNKIEIRLKKEEKEIFQKLMSIITEDQ